jgi:hypothetical protein
MNNVGNIGYMVEYGIKYWRINMMEQFIFLSGEKSDHAAFSFVSKKRFL